MQLTAQSYLKYLIFILYLVQNISYDFTNTTPNKKTYLQKILTYQLFSTSLA